MNPEIEVSRLLKADGAILKREKNHEVWKLSNGKSFVRAKTPSDANGPLNNLTDLKKALGVADPERGKPGERRERKTKAPPTVKQSLTVPTVNGALQERLLVTGITDRARVVQIAELTERIANQRVELALLSERQSRCWGCRLSRSRFVGWIGHRLRVARTWLSGRASEAPKATALSDVLPQQGSQSHAERK